MKQIYVIGKDALSIDALALSLKANCPKDKCSIVQVVTCSSGYVPILDYSIKKPKNAMCWDHAANQWSNDLLNDGKCYPGSIYQVPGYRDITDKDKHDYFKPADAEVLVMGEWVLDNNDDPLWDKTAKYRVPTETVLEPRWRLVEEWEKSVCECPRGTEAQTIKDPEVWKPVNNWVARECRVPVDAKLEEIWRIVDDTEKPNWAMPLCTQIRVAPCLWEDVTELEKVAGFRPTCIYRVPKHLRPSKLIAKTEPDVHAKKGYRIVTSEEKEKYPCPKCAMPFAFNAWHAISLDKWYDDLVYQVPIDFEFRAKWYYITEQDKKDFEKPDFAEFEIANGWDRSISEDWSQGLNYRIPSSRRSELVSKWVVPTDDDVARLGRLVCEVKNYTSGAWIQNTLTFVDDSKPNYKFVCTFNQVNNGWEYCRVLRSKLKQDKQGE